MSGVAADSLRLYLHDYIEDELELSVRKQGKRLVVTQEGEPAIIVLVTEGKP